MESVIIRFALPQNLLRLSVAAWFMTRAMLLLRGLGVDSVWGAQLNSGFSSMSAQRKGTVVSRTTEFSEAFPFLSITFREAFSSPLFPVWVQRRQVEDTIMPNLDIATTRLTSHFPAGSSQLGKCVIIHEDFVLRLGQSWIYLRPTATSCFIYPR